MREELCAHCKTGTASFVTTEKFIRKCYGYRETKRIDYYQCDSCKELSYKPCVTTNTAIQVPAGIARRLRFSHSLSSATAVGENSE